MKEEKNCPCCSGGQPKTAREYHIGDAEPTLADLPIGVTATVVKVLPQFRGRKKFADIGLVAGTELVMEAHAPFGGLLRVKVMESSMAMHRDDAANILVKKGAR